MHCPVLASLLILIPLVLAATVPVKQGDLGARTDHVIVNATAPKSLASKGGNVAPLG
ncbi:hypothetical protein FRC11_000098, partial [Ceratobasidium sp. 423]